MTLTQLRNNLLPDSKMWLWINAMGITEAPLSYRLVSAISSIGCALKNNAYFDLSWCRIKPIVRYILIGPSGIGKDTTINFTKDIIRFGGRFPIVGGSTMESVLKDMSDMVPPAAAFLPVGELSALVGKRDYQQGAMVMLTDVMSDNDVVDISLKSTPGKTLIHQPMLVLAAGSTQEWLHALLPSGALEGGFIPRTLIIAEEYSDKFISVPRFSLTRKELAEALDARKDYESWYRNLCERWASTVRPIDIDIEAWYNYDNWYRNRASYFSTTVRPYAFRSREGMLKLCMISAASRDRTWIDVDDVRFAGFVMKYIAERIDQVVVGKSSEGKCRHDILMMLPATKADFSRRLLDKYDSRVLDTAVRSLVEGNIIRLGPNGYTKIIEEVEN